MDEAAAVSDVSAHTYAWKPLTNQHPIARAFSASDFRDILLAKVAASAHEEVADQSPMERLRDGICWTIYSHSADFPPELEPRLDVASLAHPGNYLLRALSARSTRLWPPLGSLERALILVAAGSALAAGALPVAQRYRRVTPTNKQQHDDGSAGEFLHWRLRLRLLQEDVARKQGKVSRTTLHLRVRRLIAAAPDADSLSAVLATANVALPALLPQLLDESAVQAALARHPSSVTTVFAIAARDQHAHLLDKAASLRNLLNSVPAYAAWVAALVRCDRLDEAVSALRQMRDEGFKPPPALLELVRTHVTQGGGAGAPRATPGSPP